MWLLIMTILVAGQSITPLVLTYEFNTEAGCKAAGSGHVEAALAMPNQVAVIWSCTPVRPE